MTTSLQSILNQSGDPVAWLRNQQVGPNAYPGVPAEFTNWRDEQRGWAKTCVLYNQSYHMAELMVEGPGAFEFLNGLGINSFKGFVPDRAKQFVLVTNSGHVIGDVILFYLAENQFNLVGRAPVLNWLMFHAQGREDVTLTYDERTAARPVMEFPSAVYAMHPFDRVEKDGKLVGISTWIGYTRNEDKMLTLAMVDESVAEPGTEVDFIWGEPDGGTAKPAVEPHRQVTIKAIVAPAPYFEVARTAYAPSWRSKAA